MGVLANRQGCACLRSALVNLSLTLPKRTARIRSAGPSTVVDIRTKLEQITNIPTTERVMSDLVQDVVSLVCMSTFLVSMAIWIGAM